MRILVLAPQPFYTDRGTPIAIRMLVETLADDGCDVDVLCFNEGSDLPHSGVRVIRVGRRLSFRDVPPGFSGKKLLLDVLIFFGFLRLMVLRRYDVVHAVEETAFFALFVCPLFRVPYVVDVDSDMTTQLVAKFTKLSVIGGFLRWLEQLPVRLARGVVACAEGLAEPIRRATRTPVFVLSDVSLLDAASPTEARDPLDEIVMPTIPVVMYIGNLEPYQGIDLLLESFAVVNRSANIAHLVVVGGASGDIDRYKIKAQDLDLARSCHFVGPQPVTDIGMWMRRADILVSPRIEGINTPMKIYSYLDSGTPVVATDLPTHTQVLRPEFAALVDPKAPELASAILELIENPPRGQQLASAAREFIRREHSLEAFQRNVRRIYGSLFSAYPAATSGMR